MSDKTKTSGTMTQAEVEAHARGLMARHGDAIRRLIAKGATAREALIAAAYFEARLCDEIIENRTERAREIRAKLATQVWEGARAKAQARNQTNDNGRA